MTNVALMAVSPAANTLNGQGWRQLGELSVALVLSAAIGVEREVRLKDAGLRTHTLVGVGSALFMLVSKYGFTDVLERGLVVVDPSRMAAQIVSGIGFIGAGLIFVRRGSVRGLTTAASVWVTAAVGTAAGAGLLILAVFSTAVYFLVALAFPLLRRRLPSAAAGTATLRVYYPDGHGLLRRVINEATQRGFTVDDLATETASDGREPAGRDTDGSPPAIAVMMHVRGRRPASELAAALCDLDYVQAVMVSDMDVPDE